MMGPAVLVLALAVSSADPLAAAQAALARGAYAEAEELALKEARPPRAGAALYLAGLARFRGGRPKEALQALDAAGRTGDPPAAALLQYNRGACLSELARHREAERAFVQAAARDPALAPAALVNAAYAALDRGSLKRARALARRALAAGAAVDIVAELEADIDRPKGEREEEGASPAQLEYRAGIKAFDGQRYEEARERFQRAADLDPAEPRSRIMAGVVALKLGERAKARAELEQALQLALDDEEEHAAREYLDALSPGLASRGRGFEVLVRAGGGFDSGAGQSGALDPQSLAPLAGVASATGTAAFGLTYRARLKASVFAEAAYGLDQLAYLSPDAADYSLQNHALLGSLEWELGRARLGAFAGGQLVFSGLGAFRGLRGSALAGGWAVLDEREWTSTRLDLAWAGSAALRPEFDYLSGNRADAALSQQLRAGASLAFDVTYRFRYDGMGVLPNDTPVSGSESCPHFCIQETRTPFGYRSHAAALSGRAALGARVRLELAGGIEWRSYLGHETLTLVSQGHSAPPSRSVEIDRLREDSRLFASLGTGVRLSRTLELLARYEVTVNRSNVGADSFAKHVLALETGFSW
jgi:tetratricopeptide (TPR) repeat protein